MSLGLFIQCHCFYIMGAGASKNGGEAANFCEFEEYKSLYEWHYLTSRFRAILRGVCCIA